MKPGDSSNGESLPGDSRGLALILLLAAALRVLGIWHSYPFSYYGDEVHFVERALSFGSFDFNPHWFHKPAFYMYFLFFEYGVFFVIGKVVGLWGSVAEFATAHMMNPGPFYLIGRSTTALFALGTVWMVYKFAKKHIDRETGVLAALFLALSFGHVVSSQHVKADVPATFLAFVSMYFLVNFVATERYRDLLLAAVFAGVGAATKLYSLVMLVPILASVAVVMVGGTGPWIRKAVGGVARAAGATAMFWVSYFVCAPYSFLDPLGRQWAFRWARKVAEGLERVVSGEVSGPRGDTSGVWDWLGEPLLFLRTLLSTEGMGPVIGTLGLMGLLFLLFRSNLRLVVFLLFPFVFFGGTVYLYAGLEPRHQLSLYPFLAIGAGALVVFAAKQVRKRQMVYWALSLALLLPLYGIVDRGLRISKTDTRNLAKAWIEETLPAGARLVVDEDGPVLMQAPRKLRAELQRAALASETEAFTAQYDNYLSFLIQAAEKSTTFEIFEIRFPWWRGSLERGGAQYLTSDYDRDFGNPLKLVGVNPYQFYVDQGFEYAVVQSGRYEPWLNPSGIRAANYPGFAEFYRDLFERGLLIKEFDPRAGDRPGPVVKVFAFR